MSQLKFVNLPEAVEMLIAKIDQLEKSLKELNLQTKHETQQTLLSVQQAAEFLNLAVPTVYSMVSRGMLPHMKRSKRLYFSKEDLMAYIRAGRHKTYAEIRSSALDCIIKPEGIVMNKFDVIQAISNGTVTNNKTKRRSHVSN